MAEHLTEKVSVNINTSTLSGIDLLVDNGYYSNRSDFINQALRGALQQHQTTIDRLVERNTGSCDRGSSWFFGVSGFTPGEIEEMYRDGETVDMKGYGVLVIDDNCDREKLFAVVKSIRVRGKVICAPDVKANYGIK